MGRDFWIYNKRGRIRARKVTCTVCGKDRLIHKNRKDKGICRPCWCEMINPKVKDCELHIKNKKGSNSRARKVICKTCGKELIIQKNRKHCGLCQSCNAKQLSEKNVTFGINLYRKTAYQFFEKKCFCCGSTEIDKIIVHHIDQNRKNNNISNLIILCKSCHKYLHRRLRKGLTHLQAIEQIKKIKEDFKYHIKPLS